MRRSAQQQQQASSTGSTATQSSLKSPRDSLNNTNFVEDFLTRPATPLGNDNSSINNNTLNTNNANTRFRTQYNNNHNNNNNHDNINNVLENHNKQTSVKAGLTALFFSIVLISSGSSLARESKRMKDTEIPTEQTRKYLDKVNEWKTVYLEEFKSVEWMLVDNDKRGEEEEHDSSAIETLITVTSDDGSKLQATKLSPNSYKPLWFQSTNLLETYVLPKIYPNYLSYMPTIEHLYDLVNRGLQVPQTQTQTKNNYNETHSSSLVNNDAAAANNNNNNNVFPAALNNSVIVSKLLEMPLSLSLVGKDISSKEVVASIDLGSQKLFEKITNSNVNNKVCRFQMGGYFSGNTQSCATYSSLVKLCFKVRIKRDDDGAKTTTTSRWVLDDSFGNFGCEPGSLKNLLLGRSSSSSSNSIISSNSISISSSGSGSSSSSSSSSSSIVSSGMRYSSPSDTGSSWWKPDIRKRVEAPQMKSSSLPDMNKIRLAVGEQTVTIQHASDPEIWLRNQTLSKITYERRRAKVSIEGVVLIVVGSCLGIPGLGLLLFGCIKRKSKTITIGGITMRKGYVQLGPDFV